MMNATVHNCMLKPRPLYREGGGDKDSTCSQNDSAPRGVRLALYFVSAAMPCQFAPHLRGLDEFGRVVEVEELVVVHAVQEAAAAVQRDEPVHHHRVVAHEILHQSLATAATGRARGKGVHRRCGYLWHAIWAAGPQQARNKAERAYLLKTPIQAPTRATPKRERQAVARRLEHRATVPTSGPDTQLCVEKSDRAGGRGRTNHEIRRKVAICACRGNTDDNADRINIRNKTASKTKQLKIPAQDQTNHLDDGAPDAGVVGANGDVGRDDPVLPPEVGPQHEKSLLQRI